MKKVLTTLMTLFVLSMSIFTLTACGGAEFKVNFVVDGAVYATIDTSGQEIIKMPENPTKEGYTFDGWYWDKDTWQTPFTANSLLDAPLSSDMNVYAKWKANVVNVESINLNKTEITLHENDVEYLTATVLPNNATEKGVTWSSSNSSIVTVENGTITAVGYGSATITVTTIDGNKTATCVVEVVEDKITFNTLSVEDETVYGKVSNDTTTYSFLKEVVEHGNATYKVYKEITCETEINSKSISLNVGDNTVYILQTVGRDLKLYTVTVRRRPMYEVTFNVGGGTVVSSKTVEEDSFLVEPTTTRTGYTLECWNYDFSKPITKNTKITAQWKINQYTLTIVYGNGQENTVIKQDYNSEISAIANPIERAGYDFISWDKNIPTTMPAQNLTITATWQSIFTLSRNTITGLTSYGKNNYTELIIPSMIDGVSITSIGASAFYNCSSLTSIEIPNSVTSIGNSAFYGCSSLTKVNYTGTIDEWAQIKFVYYDSNPLYYAENLYINGVLQTEITINAEKINAYAFYNCSSLTSVVIGDSVTSIGERAFEDCSSLTKVNYLGTIESWAQIKFGNYTSTPLYCAENLYIKDVLQTEITINAEKINAYAFYKCRSLTSVVIGDSVTSISDCAFNGCSSLKSIEIPNSVTSIGYGAFGGCYSLKSVEIGDSVTSIGEYAFYNCDSLTSVVIGDSVTSIGDRAFQDCSSLTKVNYTGTIDEWAQIKFGNYDSNPLYYAENLYINGVLQTEITINAEKINAYAFYNCSSLTSVVIGDSVTSIGDFAFEDCRSLTSVVIGDSVTSIGDWAFSNCDSLTSVEIGDSVTSIGDRAFGFCSSLTRIKYRGTESQWQAISKGSSWNSCTGNYTITYNYTGN